MGKSFLFDIKLVLKEGENYVFWFGLDCSESDFEEDVDDIFLLECKLRGLEFCFV